MGKVNRHLDSGAGTALVLLIGAMPLLAGNNLRASEMEQVVTTATRSEYDPHKLMGSISTLNPEALALTAHSHIQESLLRIPGVNLHRGNGQEYLPAIRSPVLTGAGACGGFLMAEDGIPLRAAGFCNVNELFEAHTELAQRIEVLRGPGTALYGSNALHGVVNVITQDNTTHGGQVGIESGPYDYARLKISAGLGGASSGAGISISLAHDGGYRDESGFDQQKISGRHRYQQGQLRIDSGFTYSNLNQETAGFITGLDAYKDSAVARSNPNPEAFRDARALRVWSRTSYQLDNDSRVVVTPYLRYTDMDFLQHFLPGDPLEENGQKSVGMQTAYYFSPLESTDVIVGIDGEFTEGFLKQTQDFPTQGSAFLQATIPVGKQYDYAVDATMVSPYAQLDWSVSKKLRLTLGLRYEYMNYDYRNNMLTGRTRDDGTSCGFGGCRYSRPASGENSFDNWSPRLGLSYQINDAQLLYINAARGFRAPQATELYRLQRAQAVADLDSEQADSLELGIKGRTAALDYAFALYAMKKNHVIFRDSDFFNVSDGETGHRGAELELLYRFGGNFDFGVSANYATHRYRHNQILSGINIRNNDVDTAPRAFGSARLGWRFMENGRVELEWQHMGSYYLDPENLHEYAGHDLLNLRVGWSPGYGLQLYGRINNIADRAYAERADFTSFSNERYFPGTPRTFFAGVEWRW